MGKVIRCQRKGKPNGVFKTHKHHRVAAPYYRTLDYSERNGYIRGVVKAILHDPGRGAPLAKVEFRDPYKYKNHIKYFLAAEGTYSGQYIFCGSKATVSVGNVLPISQVP